MANLLQIIFAVLAASFTVVMGGYLEGYGNENSLESYHHDEYSHPHYTFKYSVHDPHTGDVKNQWETREGDVVKGSYSVVEADGSVRQVDYQADKIHGFHAVVRKDGKLIHPEPVQKQTLQLESGSGFLHY